MNCSICDKPVDPTAPGTVQKVVAWERRSLAASRRGGHDIIAREHMQEFAHGGCVAQAKVLSPAQESLAL